MTAMVSESMAALIAAIAMADFMKRMLNSSPDWTGDARAFRPAASAAGFPAGRLADMPRITRLPYRKHGVLPGTG